VPSLDPGPGLKGLIWEPARTTVTVPEVENEIFIVKLALPLEVAILPPFP
jgi:hypothetical protein